MKRLKLETNFIKFLEVLFDVLFIVVSFFLALMIVHMKTPLFFFPIKFKHLFYDYQFSVCLYLSGIII